MRRDTQTYCLSRGGSRFQMYPAKIYAFIVESENTELAIYSKANGNFKSRSRGRRVTDK